jgi:hypothetical protein
MPELIKVFTAPINVLWAAAVSAVISAFVAYAFRRSETRYKVRVEYEFEQRRRFLGHPPKSLGLALE